MKTRFVLATDNAFLAIADDKAVDIDLRYFGRFMVFRFVGMVWMSLFFTQENVPLVQPNIFFLRHK